MAGGSLAQAKRRSAEVSTEESNLIDINGHQLAIVAPEPTQEDIKTELARKRCLNRTLKEKEKTVLEPVINSRL